MRVTVPASSANLGAGFDALGMALDLPFRLSTEPADDLLVVTPGHPAAVAFHRAGGEGELWWRSPIPPGRGMGFSGAARVAGALAGFLTAGRPEPDARSAALDLATELEGHPDNAAASMLGGVVVAAGGRAVRVPVAVDLEVVVWWPATETSTAASRTALPDSVPFADAVANVGRASLLVAALAAGDLRALGVATEDRLHQERRLAASPPSAVALAALRSADGVVAAWLSGSGPTVAGFVEPGCGAAVLDHLPAEGTGRVLSIDQRGAVVG